jgi:hypothetical protein
MLSRSVRTVGPLLLVASLAAGALFVHSLGTLWPMVPIDLNQRDDALISTARGALAERGLEVGEHRAATRLSVDEGVLQYIERSFGREVASRLAQQGPVYTYEVIFARRDDPNRVVLVLHPDGRVLGWWRGVQDDESAPEISEDEARAIALIVLAGNATDPQQWREAGLARRERPARVDLTFTFERYIEKEPELRDRLTVTFSGNELTSVSRALVVPGAEQRAGRARQAPGEALAISGVILLSLAIIGAFIVFLRSVRDGSARLGRAGALSVIIFSLMFGSLMLQSARLLLAWDPLWPRWISMLRYFAEASADYTWLLLVLFTIIVAGDALDRKIGAGRSETLWLLVRGKVAAPAVGLAALRGFLVGLICGGVMAASVWLLYLGGAHIELQPRGFFFQGLNASMPALALLFFFLNVALLEELGYRFFGGTWLEFVTGRRWLAILIPAVVYGMTHATLSFLPPAEPFWARSLVMTLVGAVWGWAFFRYDALTVVLSHFTADLFIFNWTRLSSGDPQLVAIALATISVPLLPAVIAGVASVVGRRERGTA